MGISMNESEEKQGLMPVEVGNNASLMPIENLIHEIRGQQVMIDSDLARLYGGETKRLKEQIRRNINRFPVDFMFELTKEECSRSQIATLNANRGQNLKYPQRTSPRCDRAHIKIAKKLLAKFWH